MEALIYTLCGILIARAWAYCERAADDRRIIKAWSERDVIHLDRRMQNKARSEYNKMKAKIVQFKR